MGVRAIHNFFLLLDLASDELIQLLLDLQQFFRLRSQFPLVLFDCIILQDMDRELFDRGEKHSPRVFFRNLLDLGPQSLSFDATGRDI